MSFAVGSLVRARGREWVVLPESDGRMLIVRPLGGTNEEVTGIYLPLEDVVSAQFDLPNPELWGDYRSCHILRDAVRLGFRSSSGPFRSFARIAVEPRPYQLVPLMMALRLDPVRLLIADDVGVGKTIEAGLIARELVDRREVERMAVLCPPHLAEQWQTELQEKFHIEAELVLSSTAAQLERHCRRDESLFEHYPFVIISTDFIKADRRREDFMRTCPELVIVDEAHTCAFASEGRGGRHQRYQLISSLAQQKERHLILVTATPHSGDEEAFRSLLTLLDEDFKDLPEDLAGKQNERYRQHLAAHFIQRRRGDIQAYLKKEAQIETPFPVREDSETHYVLAPEYRRLVDKIMSYARETVKDTSGGRNRQRVRWWSVLALLRSVASSPAAAVFTLRNRAQVAGAETEEEADAIGRQTVLDLTDSDATEGIDVTPGGDFEDRESGNDTSKVRSRLLAMARDAEALKGAKDAKLQQAITLIGELVKDGYQPIVFCRFIPTAEYVAQELRKHLPKNVEVAAITGQIPPAEREERVDQLAKSAQRVLVCTDCLSEGINLQEQFNAVFHYDLSWNPTRHEQREGRVDRFGQASPKVRVTTYYGQNNIIDSIVLDVLINKHRKIRNTLGISVPVPLNTEQVVEAIFESVLSHDEDPSSQQQLPGFDDALRSQRDELFKLWDASSEREEVSRNLFAHYSIKPDEVSKELKAVQAAIGLSANVSDFTKDVLQAYGAFMSVDKNSVNFNLKDVPVAVRDAINMQQFVFDKEQNLRVSFTQPGLANTIYLNRTHPLIEGLAAYVMDTALDSIEDTLNKPIARRCGVIRTSKVQTRTTLLLTRMRFHITTPPRAGVSSQPLLAEDCRVFAFRGLPANAHWFDDEQDIETLLTAHAEANLFRAQINHFLRQVLDSYDEYIGPRLAQMAGERASELSAAHRRVRRASSLSVRNVSVEPQLPPDVLGMYIYLPLHG